MMQGLDIHSAKIATLGERAEDIFFVTKKDGQPMTETEAETFAAQLKSALDEASSQVCGQHLTIHTGILFHELEFIPFTPLSF